MFIKYFGVENFKVFSKFTEFEFAPITVLTGKNNSGKSSLIKALQVSSESTLEELKFNDQSGDIENCLNWNSNDQQMSFAYNISPEFGNCCVRLDYENGAITNILLYNKDDKSELLRIECLEEEEDKSEFYDSGDGTGVYDKIVTFLNFKVKWDFSYLKLKYHTNLTTKEIKKKIKDDFLKNIGISGKLLLDRADKTNNPFRAFSENEEKYNIFWVAGNAA